MKKLRTGRQMFSEILLLNLEKEEEEKVVAVEEAEEKGDLRNKEPIID